MSDKPKMPDGLHFETRSILGAEGRPGAGEPVSTPIYQSTIFATGSSQALGEAFQEGSERFYARLGNPTVEALARVLANLEGAEAATMFASGMGATSTALLALMEKNGHAVVHDSVYGQTVALFEYLRNKFGFAVTFVDTRDIDNLREALRPETNVVMIETPSNPQLQVIDIRNVAAVLEDSDCTLIVDSTFASPALQRPIELGADLVIHSCTKFLGGHSDVMGGVVAGRRQLVDRIKHLHRSLGGVLDPHAAWLIHRGIKTLGLRVERQSRNALAIAEALIDHPAIFDVRYPWLDNHPQYALARQQMSAGGGVLSFWMKEGIEAGRRFLDELKIIPITTSLGGIETVIEIPSEFDYSMDGSGGATALAENGHCLVRLSVGIEDVNDLLSDLMQALDKVAVSNR